MTTMTKTRLAAAEERMSQLLAGAATVDDAVLRLASDPLRLSWLPIDLRRGDLASILGRVSSLPAEEVCAGLQALQRRNATRNSAAYYQDQTTRDNAAALDRAGPRVRRDDD